MASTLGISEDGHWFTLNGENWCFRGALVLREDGSTEWVENPLVDTPRPISDERTLPAERQEPATT